MIKKKVRVREVAFMVDGEVIPEFNKLVPANKYNAADLINEVASRSPNYRKITILTGSPRRVTFEMDDSVFLNYGNEVEE